MTEAWIHNAGTSDLFLEGINDQVLPNLPCQVCVHPPGITELARDFIAAFPAVIFNVSVAESATLNLSSRLFELSRLTQPVGVELPIVREDEFLTQPARLIAVPSGPEVRATLRVYDPRRTQAASAQVEVLALNGTLLGTSLIQLQYRAESAIPGMAVIDLNSLFPAIYSVSRYDVRVTPVPAQTEYYAFVSVTDNDTQQVFMITP
jgi:hypothetical protein